MKCLFIEVKYYLKKGTRSEFYRRFRDNNIRELSISEEGNIDYEIYLPADAENEVHLYEKWESKEAQENHQQTLHFAILTELKTKYVKKIEVSKSWLEPIEG